MRRRRALQAALCLAAAGTARAQAPQVGELKPLGQDRYQVGRIVVDKRRRSFVVPARVLALGKPLEYLLTSPGGLKAYETLFEADATGSEFNLACILVGLERDTRNVGVNYRPRAQLPGPRVTIRVSWTEEGRRREMSAAEALANTEAGIQPGSVEWVYTGSPASSADGRFTTDDTGTLVGFIHDPNTLVEATLPIGLGAYGSVRGNPALSAAGSAVELTIEVTGATK